MVPVVEMLLAGAGPGQADGVGTGEPAMMGDTADLKKNRT